MNLKRLIFFHTKAGRAHRVLEAVRRGAQLAIQIKMEARLNDDQLSEALKLLIDTGRIDYQVVKNNGNGYVRYFPVYHVFTDARK
jgi:hypothetical protein